MEAEKRPSLESSANEEGDLLAAQDHLEEEEDSAKRSYGCTFCKRGFTNAQALGGHMNIHRKDRVKGKGHLHHQHQVPVPSSNDVKKTLPDADNSSINPDPVGGEGTHPMIPCAIISQVQRGFIHQNKCCQILVANPIRPRHKLRFMESDLMVRIPQSLGRTDRGLLDDDLRLRIGPSASPDCKEAKISQKKTEIDLELRLGRDP